MTRIFLKIFIIFFVKISYAKNFPPEVITDAETRAAVAEIEKIKIPQGGFKAFYFDRKFAEIANDYQKFPDYDLKQAIVLPQFVHAVAITVTEKKPESKYLFTEYECRLHLFVDHKDDYWLPADRSGSWFSIRDLDDEAAGIAGLKITDAYRDMSIDFNMRSFYGNTETDHLKHYPQVLGSLSIDKYIKEVYPGFDYIQYHSFCHGLMSQKDHLSVWQEKKTGPDLQLERKYHYAEDFYIFTIPKRLIKESCEYIRVAAYYYDWNTSGISNLIKFTYVDQTPGEFWARLGDYNCDFK